MADRASWSQAQEIAIYHPGQKVQIKHRPGVVDTVIAYDPMMVPPIVLAIDPQPRYPEELTLVDRPAKMFDWLNPWARNPSGVVAMSHQ
ncbi:hypothetical protein [Chamaesiphon sp. GL140_3_metabinner_50]|uniref:hypothetical protein n=1 Tax=Chamaesiphon sp. GL140_3_metabinner_50 TaxID=2970812 RepID=UPI0025FB8415|nr:hypothetical protein [Chamaesiphon sp. GL140_3_metabinner_50]